MRKAATVIAMLALSVLSSAAQVRPGRAGPPPAAEAGVSPAEVQKMFDAYALMQAQEQLQINDSQFSAFLTRYKALQDARRRTLQGHTRLVMEMRRLLNQGQPDDAQIKELLKQLQDVDAQGAADEKKAYEGIDQVLDLRQQAKFRIFEEVMERRKLELIARARQAGRGAKPQ